MKEYFITSDIHSFYSIMKQELDKKGFNINNPDHIFVCCGDLFDRGPESVELLKFIRSIPKERRILIRGNHEYLLKKLVEKKLPDYYDITNGTVKTILSFVSSINSKEFGWLDPDDFCIDYYFAYGDDDRYKETKNNLEQLWKKVCKTFKKLNIVDWIFGQKEFKDNEEWVDYLELSDYIFVHATIPKIAFWRERSTRLNWAEASWPCPYEFYDIGFFSDEEANGKVMVCGHWHASDFHERYEGDGSENFDIYYGPHLIAIDACTAYSKKSNVLVLEETKTGNYIIKK